MRKPQTRERILKEVESRQCRAASQEIARLRHNIGLAWELLQIGCPNDAAHLLALTMAAPKKKAAKLARQA